MTGWVDTGNWVYEDEAVVALVLAASEAAAVYYMETGRVHEELENALERVPIAEEEL